MKKHISFKLIVSFLFVLNVGCNKEKEKVTPTPETGTVQDIEGNVYKTIKIGNQWWMAENLRVKTYRNGMSIRKIQDDAVLWGTDTNGAFCRYFDDPKAPGLLYNYYTITNINQLAPAGWHIPSDEEWKELERQLGMSVSEADKGGWRGTDQGNKLKVVGTTGWTAFEDQWPTNESGFSALAGSCRLFDGTWGAPGLFFHGFWWTSTASDSLACYRYLDYKNLDVFRSYTYKNYGFSVRCIKD